MDMVVFRRAVRPLPFDEKRSENQPIFRADDTTTFVVVDGERGNIKGDGVVGDEETRFNAVHDSLERGRAGAK